MDMQVQDEITSHVSCHSVCATRGDERKHEQTLLDLVHRLLKVELLHFHANPLKYWLFSHQFDNNGATNYVYECHKLLVDNISSAICNVEMTTTSRRKEQKARKQQ